MHFINDKCVVGEVGSYCQLAVTLFFFTSPYQIRDNLVPQLILTYPFHKSGSAPDSGSDNYKAPLYFIIMFTMLFIIQTFYFSWWTI